MKINLLLLMSTLLCFALNAQSFEELTFVDDDFPFNNEVKLADLDGDGDNDIVTVSNQERIITIGNFDAANNTLTTDTINTIFSSWSLELFDIDDDGLIDIVVSAPFESALFYWKNLGGFNFEKTSTSLDSYSGIHVVDLNNDGFEEMILSQDDKLIAYSLENGSINYYADIDLGGFAFRPKAIISFDKNGDGLIDLLAADDFDGIIYYEQQSSGAFARTDLLPEVFSVEHLEVADFNKDGAFDIFAQSAFNGSAKIQINNGDDTFTESQIPADIERIDLAFVVDYDSDGDEDIMYYDSGFGASGVLNAYENNNGSFTNSTFSTSYEKIETGIAGDLDNDGDMDMVFADNDFFDPSIIVYKNNLSVNTHKTTLLDVKVYPSLINDYLTIESEEELSFKIFNANGLQVKFGELQGRSQLQLSELQKGMYFIELQSIKARGTRSFIKL